MSIADNLLILIPAAALLVALLLAERQGDDRSRVLLLKTPLSLLFVLAAVVQPHPLPAYYQLVLGGLALGVVGDVCLALPGRGWFRAGLVAFLLGHVMYALAFMSVCVDARWLQPELFVFALIGALVYRWLTPHLGSMRGPVIAYIVVISAMIASAWLASRSPAVPEAGAWLLLKGAALFYLSDLFVARQRFVAQGYVNRLIGLPLYYAGQFLIAFSVGVIA